MSAQVNQNQVIYICIDVFDLFIALPSNRLLKCCHDVIHVRELTFNYKMSRLIFTAFGPFFGPFLGHFLDQFFGQFFWIILSGEGRLLVFRGGVGCSLSVLREGWEVNCCY